MQLSRALLVGSLLALTLLGSSIAGAADDPCKEAAAQFCQGMKPGDKGYTKCMRGHSKSLSKECMATLALQRDVEQSPACMADAEKFCPGVKPGGGRVMKCLRTHQSDLSENCKREIGKRSGRR
ncbi:MAG TPA: cysteine rich repeat-containing protein [Candidatus Binatia bacterium]|nr:cysteine rich repeat-containing protein [Candidatus Binatia bacterium]